MTEEKSDEKEKFKPLGRFAKMLREILGVGLWSYIALKLFVIDIDIILITQYMPSLKGYLQYKFFGLVALVVICAFLFRFRTPRAILLWAITYPLVVSLWYAPRLIWRQWPLMIALLPSIHTALADFRGNLIRYGLGIIAAFIICITTNPITLSMAMVILGVLLMAHFVRCIRSASQSNFFVRLTELIDRQVDKMHEDTWMESLSTFITKPEETLEPAELEQKENSLKLVLYCYRSIPEIVSNNLERVHRSGQLQVYMLLTLLYTISLLVTVFAFEYWALHIISPTAFAGQYSRSFVEFLALGVTTIIPSGSLTTLEPVSTMARALSLVQIICWVFVAIILLSHFTTTAREKTQTDIKEFLVSLRNFAASVEGQISKRLQLSFIQLEHSLIQSDTKTLINWLIKKQGREEQTDDNSSELPVAENTPQSAILVTKGFVEEKASIVAPGNALDAAEQWNSQSQKEEQS